MENKPGEGGSRLIFSGFFVDGLEPPKNTLHEEVHVYGVMRMKSLQE